MKKQKKSLPPENARKIEIYSWIAAAIIDFGCAIYALCVKHYDSSIINLTLCTLCAMMAFKTYRLMKTENIIGMKNEMIYLLTKIKNSSEVYEAHLEGLIQWVLKRAKDACNASMRNRYPIIKEIIAKIERYNAIVNIDMQSSNIKEEEQQ